MYESLHQRIWGRIRIEPKNDPGFFGGIKLGYVFGTGGIRFALEEDMFYNGWKSGADFTLLQDGVISQTSTDRTINTGAFMTNGLIRFNGLENSNLISAVESVFIMRVPRVPLSVGSTSTGVLVILTSHGS